MYKKFKKLRNLEYKIEWGRYNHADFKLYTLRIHSIKRVQNYPL